MFTGCCLFVVVAVIILLLGVWLPENCVIGLERMGGENGVMRV